MYKLTERRFDDAEAILEDARASLIERGAFNASVFERQLSEIWNVGYQEIKDLMNDIVKRFPRFKYVAVYYMENSNPSGVVLEFQDTLATEYGLSSFNLDAIAKLRAEFWESARTEMQME